MALNLNSSKIDIEIFTDNVNLFIHKYIIHLNKEFNNGIKYFINQDLDDMWEDYIVFYQSQLKYTDSKNKNITCSFKLNPTYNKFEYNKKLFCKLILTKRNIL